MKNLYKRIITVFLAVVTLFFSCVPCAYASGWEVLLSVPGDFWDWAVSSYYSSTENPFLSLFDKSVCPHCPDVTRRHNFKEQRTTVDGKTSLYYICEYCGKSAGEVGEEAYQNQVDSLPAPIYTSSGKLTWKIVPYVGYVSDNRPVGDNGASGERFADYVRASGTSKGGASIYVEFIVQEAFKAPIDGTYSLTFSLIFSPLLYCTSLPFILG